MSLGPRAVCLVAGATLVVVLLGTVLRRLRGTTLAAPCWWAIAVCGSLAIVAEWHFASGGAISATLRFAVAAGTFCPVMAVLGAKRPQHRGWQWVVASLWLVLVWPAGQAWLSRSELSLFVAWKLFLVGLVVVGLLNYLSTRNWFAALLVAGGQLALLTEFLWPESGFDLGEMMALAIVAFFIASLVVTIGSPPPRSWGGASEPSLAEYTQHWQTFRDSFGSLWGLRIQGRVNETAALRGWPFRLEWTGFQPTDAAAPTDEQLQELNEAWATLMRRFW